MSELSINKIKPVTSNTVVFGNSGDTIYLATGATAVGFGDTSVIEDPNDPAIDTNPDDGVGTLWLNTTNGCLFSCIDATTDDNVWINTANCIDANIGSFHGTGRIAGYTMGGTEVGGQTSEIIEKHSFTSDGDATDVGDLSLPKGHASGQSSSTDGYYSGGSSTGETTTSTTAIEKHSFTSDNDSALTSDLLIARSFPSGQSSKTHGYVSGGFFTQSQPTINKFLFSSESNVSNIGNMFQSRHATAGTNSSTHGYTTGGITNPPTVYRNTREKFSFSSDGDAVEAGNDLIARTAIAGVSSSTDGYICGGFDETIFRTNITKHSFSSDNIVIEHGDILHGAGNVSEAGHGQVGTSSTTHGYIAGSINPTIALDYIDKFSYASGGNTTDVGVLQLPRNYCSGAQV